jgi:O-antigen/teichoic acid export membrane protein
MAEGLNIPLRQEAMLPRFNSFIRQRLTPLLYSGSSVASAGAQLVAGFLVIKWVAPEEMGLWQSVRLAQIYSFILLIGINNGLGRELPFFLGKGEQAFAESLAGTAFFCVSMANLLVVICGLACAVVFAHYGSHLVWAILSVTLLITLSFYQQILICTFRSNDSFNKLTWIQFTEAGLSLATIPIVYFCHYNGMLARTVLTTAIIASLTYLLRPMRVKMRMEWSAFKLLLKTGLPIFGLDYVKNSCSTLDRLVLLRMGGFKDVGFYSLARIGFQTLAVLSQSLGSYVYPRMTFKFGQSGNPRTLWSFGIKFALVAVTFTAMAAICAWLILPWFVPAYLPKYLGGLRPTQIILIAGIFESATIIVNALWSMKAWKMMVAYQVASSILFALGPVLGIIFIGKSLEGVAWGMVIGSAGRGLLALGLSFYGTHRAGTSEPRSTSFQS